MVSSVVAVDPASPKPGYPRTNAGNQRMSATMEETDTINVHLLALLQLLSPVDTSSPLYGVVVSLREVQELQHEISALEGDLTELLPMLDHLQLVDDVGIFKRIVDTMDRMSDRIYEQRTKISEIEDVVHALCTTTQTAKMRHST